MKRNGRLARFIDTIFDPIGNKLGTQGASILDRLKNLETSTQDVPIIGFAEVGSFGGKSFNPAQYEDFSFNVILPYYTTFPYTITEHPNTTKIKQTPNNNSVSQNYEQFTDNKPEIYHLNYYVALGKDIKNNKTIEDLVSLGNRIDDGKLDATSVDGSYPLAEEYFNDYSSSFNNWKADIDSSDKTQVYEKILANIVLDSKSSKAYLNPDKKRKVFNNNNKFDIYKESSGDLYQILDETDNNLRLISDLYIDKKFEFKKDFKILEQYLKYAESETPGSGSLVELTGSIRTQEINNYELSVWMLSQSMSPQVSEDVFDFNNSNALYIGSPTNLDTGRYRYNPFDIYIRKQILAAKIKNLQKKNFRTLKDILVDKKLCETEIIGFKIVKFGTNKNPNDVIIQTTYVENDKQPVYSFVDSQLRSGIQYKYDFYFYVAVYGNRILISGDGQVQNIPDLRIFEVPATKEPEEKAKAVPPPAVISCKYPPNRPQVNAVPFFDHRYRDQLKFIFNKTVDISERGYEYYPINTADQEITDTIINSQKIKYIEDANTDPFPVRFRTEKTEAPVKYEIYRTTKVPFSYRDFEGNLLHTLGDGETEETAFIDTLVPNTKYYYTFRTVDISTGYFSNPTPVYEITMVKDSDIYYPIINIYEFKDIENSLSEDQFFKMDAGTVPYREFRKFLQIKQNNLSIGKEGKEFKIRVTSKKTNRKIDINFKLVKNS
jgi:hypothetical protein